MILSKSRSDLVLNGWLLLAFDSRVDRDPDPFLDLTNVKFPILDSCQGEKGFVWFKF